MHILLAICTCIVESHNFSTITTTDICNSILSKKSSYRQLWLLHQCSDICHVLVLPGCSALKNRLLWWFLGLFNTENCSTLEQHRSGKWPNKFGYWFLPFFPTVWKQSWQSSIQQKDSTHLRLHWLSQSCNQGTTKWAADGLPRSLNSSGKSHLAASCFHFF